MRGLKPSLAMATAGVIGLALWAGAVVERPGTEMATAAERFLEALDDERRAEATFAFDDAERLNWHFVPRARAGVPLKELSPSQQQLAIALMQTGLSNEGAVTALTIMTLEKILFELEDGAPRRDPELYFISVFGEPSNRSKWGWRVEGHHLSLNLTLEGGEVISATPTFFGANPAEVRQGPREGLRTLADREDRALRLLQALDSGQKGTAIIADEPPREIRAAGAPQPPTDEAVGLRAGAMTEEQRQMLRALIETYAMDMPAPIARRWLTEIRDNGPERVAFAWFGPAVRNEPHAYRVQGPTFLIEFNNTQNDGNHIHSIWRNMLGDFGRPIAAD